MIAIKKNGGRKMIATIIRTAILYVFVVFAIRLMGKRQIGDMQPGELVITLLISEIAAIPLQDNNQPILNGVSAIFVLAVLEIVFSALAMKNFFVRKLMSGKSVVLIKNGVLDQNAMRRVRMTVLDLVELLRAKSVFDLSTVAYAVLEVNGEVSILLKEGAQTVTLDDLNLSSAPQGLFLPVISDGKIVFESLKALQSDKRAVEATLKKQDLEVKEVFLMTLDRYGNSCIIKKRKEGEEK